MRFFSSTRVLISALLVFIILPQQLSARGSGSVWLAGADNRIDEYGNPDKCGFDVELAAGLLKTLGKNWGYGYDSLRVDLQRWQSSPYVTVDSIGASVQNRAVWELTITAATAPQAPRRTVFIHARTHPGEVQSFWVTSEIINLLLKEDDFSRKMRDLCVFCIVPMCNPDGVELEYPRENANGVDIESNWNKNPVQAEVAVLRNRFQQLMESTAPIELALNMHSAYGASRYFVYHDPAGTTAEYASLEREFIEGVQSYFPGGIRNWDYFVSWKTVTPTQYPESWFWLNYGERVMALTYEDMNDPAAGEFDRTAHALVHGIFDYLKRSSSSVLAEAGSAPSQFVLYQNYPNPFNGSTTIRWQQSQTAYTSLKIFDAAGRQVMAFNLQLMPAGIHALRIDASSLPAGIYFYRLISDGMSAPAKRMVLLK
jgi:hypothetical protein